MLFRSYQFPEPEFISKARTNYFAVKDFKAFEDELAIYCKHPWLDEPGYHIVTKELQGLTVHAILFVATDGFPMSYVNSDGEQQLIWWSSFFGRHLEDDWVAVVMEVEHQGLEYIGATSYAYNNKMEREQMSLAAIVPFATKLGSNVTEVSKEAVLYTNNSKLDHIQLEDE